MLNRKIKEKIKHGVNKKTWKDTVESKCGLYTLYLHKKFGLSIYGKPLEDNENHDYTSGFEKRRKKIYPSTLDKRKMKKDYWHYAVLVDNHFCDGLGINAFKKWGGKSDVRKLDPRWVEWKMRCVHESAGYNEFTGYIKNFFEKMDEEFKMNDTSLTDGLLWRRTNG